METIDSRPREENVGKAEDLTVFESMVTCSASMLPPIKRQEIRTSKTKGVVVSVWPRQSNLNNNKAKPKTKKSVQTKAMLIWD